MHVLDLLLYFAAAVLFGLAAFNIPAKAKVDLLALGLLAWVLVPLIAAFQQVK